MKKVLTILWVCIVLRAEAQEVNLFVKNVEDKRSTDNEKGELKLEVSV